MRYFLLFLIMLVGENANSAKANGLNPAEENKNSNQVIPARASANLQKTNEALKSDKPVIKVGIPDGFEDLLVPQLTLVDIYFNGRRVGASLASYTNETITFESPGEVVSLLENLKSIEFLQNRLSQPFNINADQVCYYTGQQNCGELKPDDIELIFDETTLRVDLFIHPRYQLPQSLQLDRYLPESTAGPSLINAFSVVASGSSERENIYTARINSLFGYENYRILGSFESDQENDFRIDQLSFVYEYQAYEYEAGSFRSVAQPSGFFPQQDLIGLRVQSTLASRVDLEQASGSQLFIFLNERSRVEIYREEQLLATQVYDAGNIELDTRDLPEGAYNIEIKIFGESGREREETRFYSKSLLLPPTNETLFFAEAGYPELEELDKFPKASDDGLFRFGFKSRPLDFFGWSSSFVQNTEQSSLEVGSYWFGNQVELQTSHAINDEDEFANYYLLNLRTNEFVLSATYRRTHGDSQLDIASENRLIQFSNRQTTLSLGLPVAGGLINIYSRTSESANEERYRALGIGWRKNIYRGNRMVVDWTLDASKENSDRQIYTGLTWRFLGNRYGASAKMNYASVRRSEELEKHYFDKQVRASYRNPDTWLGRSSTSLTVNETQSLVSADLQTELSNDYGYTRVDYQRQAITSESESNLSGTSGKWQDSYALTGRFNLVSGGGDLAIGGDRRNSAGVMLNLGEFETESLTFAVLVNGVERARVDSGASSFIALPPYQSYEIVLSPIGEELVNFDNTPRKFTLYPGNVEQLNWTVKPVKVIIVQLIQNDDRPFANARLEDDNIYARTDEQGWVQFETPSAGEFVFQNAGGICKVLIEEVMLPESINFIGTASCE